MKGIKRHFSGFLMVLPSSSLALVKASRTAGHFHGALQQFCVWSISVIGPPVGKRMSLIDESMKPHSRIMICKNTVELLKGLSFN